jgi:hypothetical protein
MGKYLCPLVSARHTGKPNTRAGKGVISSKKKKKKKKVSITESSFIYPHTLLLIGILKIEKY